MSFRVERVLVSAQQALAQELPYGVPFVLTYGVSDERLQLTAFGARDRAFF